MSGLVVGGISIPKEVEAEGAEAVAAYVAKASAPKGRTKKARESEEVTGE